MNSVELANALINRAKNLQEFTVTQTLPEGFRFNGLIPFDMKITGKVMTATIYAIDEEEANKKFDEFLKDCI